MKTVKIKDLTMFKKVVLPAFAAVGLLFSSCTHIIENKENKSMSSEFFKRPDGQTARLYQLRCADGFGVDISDHGATIIALYTPDRNGKIRNVALSWADPARYNTHPIYLGALVGRLANRVSNARFVLDPIPQLLTVADQSLTVDLKASLLHPCQHGGQRKLNIVHHSLLRGLTQARGQHAVQAVQIDRHRNGIHRALSQKGYRQAIQRKGRLRGIKHVRPQRYVKGSR